MNENKVFYKYMSAHTAHIVLANQTLRWSTPGTLNDPFDMQFDLAYDVDREVVKCRALEKLWEAYSEGHISVSNVLGVLIQELKKRVPGLSRQQFEVHLADAVGASMEVFEKSLPAVNAEVRRLLSTSKILCLTETPDNSVMWTHYADTHQGVVIRLRDYPEFDTPYVMARPVSYVAKSPVLVDDDFLSDMLSGRASFDTKVLLHRLVYTKSADWAYEREWRIYSGNGRRKAAEHEDLRFGAFELDALIFGLNIKAEDRTSLAKLVRDQYGHAELLQAARRAGSLRFDFVPFKD